MTNPNDSTREEILKHLYSVHQKARSPKSAAQKISDIQRTMKAKGLKQQEVGRNLDYLVQKGWVREVVEMRTFKTTRGTTQQAEKRTYKISDAGIDRLEAASIYQRSPASQTINVSNVRGVTVVGDGNVVNTSYTDLFRDLDAIRSAILKESELSEEQKLSALSDLEGLQAQLQKPDPDRTVVEKLWTGLERVAAVGGVLELVRAAAAHIAPLIK